MRFSAATVEVFEQLGAPFETVDVLQDMEIREGIKRYSNWPTIPQVYIFPSPIAPQALRRRSVADRLERGVGHRLHQVDRRAERLQRLDRSGALRRVADVHVHHAEHDLAPRCSGTNGSAGAVRKAHPVDTVSGASSAKFRQARMTSPARSTGNSIRPAKTIGPSGCSWNSNR